MRDILAFGAEVLTACLSGFLYTFHVYLHSCTSSASGDTGHDV
jgi:hypothetical protein